MDDEFDPLADLADITETERADVESKFISAEASVAIHALTRGRAALADGDTLGGWMYVRLLTETAIRVRWLAGPSADEPDSDRAPKIDRADTIARIAALAKRDYRLTLAAYRAVRAIRIEAGEVPSDDLSDQIAALSDRIPGRPAPNDVRQLAEISRTGLQLYAEFRNSSSIIHPGSALGRVPLGRPDRAASQLDLAAIVCAVLAAAIYKALG